MLQSWSQIFGTLKCCSTDPIIHKLKVMLEEIICSYSQLRQLTAQVFEITWSDGEVFNQTR